MNPGLRRDTFYKSVIGFMLLSTVILMIVWIPPALHKHQQLRHFQKQLETYGEDSNWYEIYQKWKEEKESKANYLRGLEARIYHESELYRLVEHWQQESKSCGIELIRYIPGTQAQDSEYLYKKIQLVLQGDFLPILQFLQRAMQITSYRNVRLVLSRSAGGLQCSLDFEVLMKAGKENGKGIQTSETE